MLATETLGLVPQVINLRQPACLVALPLLPYSFQIRSGGHYGSLAFLVGLASLKHGVRSLPPRSFQFCLLLCRPAG